MKVNGSSRKSAALSVQILKTLAEHTPPYYFLMQKVRPRPDPSVYAGITYCVRDAIAVSYEAVLATR